MEAVFLVTLLVITFLCVAYAWRLRRLERMRSDARVTALADAIDGFDGGALDAPREPASSSASELFARSSPTVGHGRPLLKLAIGFGMATVIIVLLAMAAERRDERPAAATAAVAATGDALELLSMRYQRSGNDITVTGLVRNPGGAPAGDIMAVVFAFDREGNFVASGRAPLEFATIAAGDESPFQVTVPDVGDVGRYRVSFRTGSGVVRHVDRREARPGALSTDRGASVDPAARLVS